jgi:hypothetical protein
VAKISAVVPDELGAALERSARGDDPELASYLRVE